MEKGMGLEIDKSVSYFQKQERAGKLILLQSPKAEHCPAHLDFSPVRPISYNRIVRLSMLLLKASKLWGICHSNNRKLIDHLPSQVKDGFYEKAAEAPSEYSHRILFSFTQFLSTGLSWNVPAISTGCAGSSGIFWSSFSQINCSQISSALRSWFNTKLTQPQRMAQA